MYWLKKLQKLALVLIVGLVWFDILCFVLMLLGAILKWSFLSEGFTTGLFTTFGVSLGVLTALAVLHVILSLNLLSTSAQEIAKGRVSGLGEEVPSGAERRFFRLCMWVSSFAIILVVLVMAYGEHRVSQHKLKVTLNQLEATVKSDIASRLAASIEADVALKEVVASRDAMYGFFEERHGLSVLFPRVQSGATVYYELIPWLRLDEKTRERPLSASDLPVFVPYAEEKKNFDQMLKDHHPIYSFTRSALRVYQPFLRDGKVSYILLYDTSRQVSDQYLSQSLKEREGAS